jgi:hypothetical protein
VQRRLRTAAAASAALALGLGATLLGAVPANAATHDITTPGWEWQDVEDNTANILEAYAHWDDFYGVTNMYGWNNDAFDGFIYTLNMTYTEDGQPPVEIDNVTLTNDSVDINDNGLTTIVAHGVANFADPVDVLVTLKIEGSYAQWSFEFDDGGAGILGDVQAEVIGAVGSDTMTDILYNSGADLVTSEGATGDPIIAYHFDSAAPFSWDVADGDDNIAVLFNASSDASLTVALAENDPCQYDETITAMVVMVSGLADTFGETIDPFYEPGCIVPAAAAPISLGSAVNQALPLSSSAEGFPFFGDFIEEDNFTGFAISGLPAGLSATIQYNAVTTLSEVVVTGTATTPGEYTVRLLGYFTGNGDGGTAKGSPLFIDVPLSVVLPATGPMDAAPAGLVAFALLGVGGAIVFVNARTRRA